MPTPSEGPHSFFSSYDPSLLDMPGCAKGRVPAITTLHRPAPRAGAPVSFGQTTTVPSVQTAATLRPVRNADTAKAEASLGCQETALSVKVGNL